MQCPNKPIKSTSVVVVPGVSVTITIPNEIFTPNEIFSIIICQNIPTSGYGLPVILASGGATYNLLDKCGNNIIGGELRCRTCYKIYYNDFPIHMTVVSPICNICNKTSSLIGLVASTGTAASVVLDTVKNSSKTAKSE